MKLPAFTSPPLRSRGGVDAGVGAAKAVCGWVSVPGVLGEVAEVAKRGGIQRFSGGGGGGGSGVEFSRGGGVDWTCMRIFDSEGEKEGGRADCPSCAVAGDVCRSDRRCGPQWSVVVVSCVGLLACQGS